MSAGSPSSGAGRRNVGVTIDGRNVSVPEGTLVVEAAKAAGVEVPVYCYHPKMDPVGMCRICLVEIEKFPKLQIACATRVAEGMIVHTQSPKAAEGRRGVLEFLLLNHPLDCPICDKGGECDLQDYTMSFGPGQSRLTEPKLHKPKRVDLGPTIVLDEERCILCRRCTRFDDEIAHEANLIVTERGHRSLISTRSGEPYASYFSGNTTEICPVGALTSKAYRFRSRPWDLTHADSVCAQCSVGCNFRIDARFGRVMRTMIRENPEVDGGWLCDRGRYSFNYLYEPTRLRAPRLRGDGGAWTETTLFDAVRFAAERLRHSPRVGVIGGGRSSDEEAFALQRFAREVLGTNDVDYRVHLQRFASPAAFGAKLIDLDDASLILVFGAVPAEQAPILDLRLRRAVARCGARLVHVGPFAPRFTVPGRYVPVKPGGVGALMRRLAETVHKGEPPAAGTDAVADLASALAAADKIVVVHNGRDPDAIDALDALLEALHGYGHPVGALVVGSQGNARGAEAAGCVPNLGPGYSAVDGAPGRTTLQMLRAAAAGELDALLVVGANPALTFPDGALVRAALERVPFLAVAEQVMTETARYADVVFAAAAFAEKRGHVTNLEGRRQAFAPAVQAPVQCCTDAELLASLAAALGKPIIDATPEALFAQLVRAETARGSLRPLSDAPPAVPQPKAGELFVIPMPQLYMGGGAAAHDPGLAPMRPQPFAVFAPDDASRLGLADRQRVTLSGAGGSIEVVAQVSERAAAGTVLVVADMPEAPVNRLLDASGFGVANAARVAAEVPA